MSTPRTTSDSGSAATRSGWIHGLDQGQAGPIGYTDVADIEQEVARLLAAGAAGATSRDAPHDVGGGMLIATVTDPDGNVIGLRQLP